jgi:hypothetical protein
LPANKKRFAPQRNAKAEMEPLPIPGQTSAADVVEGSTGSGIVLAAGNLILPS